MGLTSGKIRASICCRWRHSHSIATDDRHLFQNQLLVSSPRVSLIKRVGGANNTSLLEAQIQVGSASDPSE